LERLDFKERAGFLGQLEVLVDPEHLEIQDLKETLEMSDP